MASPSRPIDKAPLINSRLTVAATDSTDVPLFHSPLKQLIRHRSFCICVAMAPSTFDVGYRGCSNRNTHARVRFRTQHCSCSISDDGHTGLAISHAGGCYNRDTLRRNEFRYRVRYATWPNHMLEPDRRIGVGCSRHHTRRVKALIH